MSEPALRAIHADVKGMLASPLTTVAQRRWAEMVDRRMTEMWVALALVDATLCSAEIHGATRTDQAVYCENHATRWHDDTPWCAEHEPPDIMPDCPGHPTFNADGDPETVHCDGSCAQ